MSKLTPSCKPSQDQTDQDPLPQKGSKPHKKKRTAISYVTGALSTLRKGAVQVWEAATENVVSRTMYKYGLRPAGEYVLSPMGKKGWQAATSNTGAATIAGVVGLLTLPIGGPLIGLGVFVGIKALKAGVAHIEKSYKDPVGARKDRQKAFQTVKKVGMALGVCACIAFPPLGIAAAIGAASYMGVKSYRKNAEKMKILNSPIKSPKIPTISGPAQQAPSAPTKAAPAMAPCAPAPAAPAAPKGLVAGVTRSSQAAALVASVRSSAPVSRAPSGTLSPPSSPAKAQAQAQAKAASAGRTV